MRTEEIIMRKTFLILLAFVLLVAAVSCNRSKSTNSKKLTIAVIPKGTSHEFWKSIHAGSIKAQRELSTNGAEIEVIWKGPLKEDDREMQIQVVEGFASQGVNGIVLAPLDNRALARPVGRSEECRRADGDYRLSAGVEFLCQFCGHRQSQRRHAGSGSSGRIVGRKGKVIMLRYAEGSASTEEREAGFLEEMKQKYPNIEIISSDQHAGATRDSAKSVAENLLNRFGDDVQGIFCPNESTTAGMLSALQDNGKAGKVIFVGFDTSQMFIDAMRAKQLHGIVVQNPFNMGYLGVRTMVESLQGKAVEKRIDTGVTMITPENLDAKDTQALLHPPLDQYLK